MQYVKVFAFFCHMVAGVDGVADFQVCDKVLVGDNQVDPQVTMGDCMTGKPVAKFIEDHPEFQKLYFGKWQCKMGNKPIPDERGV